MKRVTPLMLPVAAAVMLGASASAFAVPGERLQTVVEYDSNELTSEAGREAVRARLAAAADRVCDISHPVRTTQVRMTRKCVREALANAELELERRVAAAEERERIRVADSRR